MSDNRRCTTEYRESISAYLDGDLDGAERDALLAHLATCQACRETLESYRRIGGQLRSLPRAVPPEELRDAIYAQTINSGSRKVYLFTSRFGYSVAAVAAVLLLFVVAVYLLINGYQRSLDPEIVASQPGNGVLWPLSRPVEITFNKEMDKESVESALSIVPASEKDRLTVSWDGNTLVLGRNQTLHSASSYTILITTSAEDTWGKNLGSAFRLQFETSESFALQTPEPRPTATATHTATKTPTADTTTPPVATEDDEDAAQLVPTGEPTPTPTASLNNPGGATATAPPAVPTNDTPDSTNPPAVAPTNTPAPLPTATPPPAVEPTATPQPTVTPEPSPTPQPEPTATPTDVAPTATPTSPPPTPTPDTIAVVGALGNVYWSNDLVSSRLGAPVSGASVISAIELDFQHGAMVSRSDSGQTYVLESANGIWSVLPSAQNSASSEVGPIPDTWLPGGSLGALWTAEPWIQTALGYALAPSGTVFDSTIQHFEQGTMLMSSSGQVYVIYDSNGTWELYPDPGS